MISAVQQDKSADADKDTTDTNTPKNNAGNAFGGKEGAKRNKVS